MRSFGVIILADIDGWMPWHIAEYLADTMHLSTLEHGAYLLLLGHGWRNDGVIIANDSYLAGITRLPREQWAEIKPTVSRFFEAFDHPMLGACWRQKRQTEELEKAKGYKSRAVEKARKAANSRWGGCLEHVPSISSSNACSMPLNGKGKEALDPLLGGDARGGTTKPTAKDEFWTPLCQIFGIKPVTIADEQRLYQQCTDFRLKGATEAEIVRRVGVYRQTFPNTVLTPKAVLNNWDVLSEPQKPKTKASPWDVNHKKQKAL